MPAFLNAFARGCAVVGALSLLPLSAALAADEHYRKDGVAIGGTDAVAYHTVGKPMQGSPQFSAEYQGATWH